MLLKNGVYPYEYMDSWEKFDETSLPDKTAFYSELNLKDITDKDYDHVQKLFEEFCKNISEYHNLHVQCDTLLLADQMFLKNLETNVLKYTDLTLLISYLHLD